MCNVSTLVKLNKNYMHKTFNKKDTANIDLTAAMYLKQHSTYPKQKIFQ